MYTRRQISAQVDSGPEPLGVRGRQNEETPPRHWEGVVTAPVTLASLGTRAKARTEPRGCPFTPISSSSFSSRSSCQARPPGAPGRRGWASACHLNPAPRVWPWEQGWGGLEWVVAGRERDLWAPSQPVPLLPEHVCEHLLHTSSRGRPPPTRRAGSQDKLEPQRNCFQKIDPDGLHWLWNTHHTRICSPLLGLNKRQHFHQKIQTKTNSEHLTCVTWWRDRPVLQQVSFCTSFRGPSRHLPFLPVGWDWV